MYKKIIFILLLIVLLSHFLFRIFTYKEEYTSKFDPKYWEDRYLRSQWFARAGCGDYDPHINPKTCVWDDAWYSKEGKFKRTKKFESIGDDGLYAYAGWEYINGRDPTTLNAEMPPLGKYLIGLSIKLFNNQNLFALFSGIGVIIALYFLSKQILKDSTLSIAVPLLFSFEPLFYTQLRAPFLDLLYLFFGILIIYFILRKSFVFSVIFLGCMMATKASVATFVIIAATTLSYFFLTKRYADAKRFFLLTPISIGVFLLIYLQFFLLGKSITDFMRVQKYVMNFYLSGAKGSISAAWEILLTGRYVTWWKSSIIVTEWSITWLFLTILAIIGLLLMIRQKEKGAILLIVLWIIVYLGFLSSVPIFPRYLLSLLPFLYIVAFWLGQAVYKKVISKKT